MKQYCSILGFLTIMLLIASCNRDVELEEGHYQYNNSLIQVFPNAVTDVDGNSYNAVKIGDQYWMKENLRTTRYADGSELVEGSTLSVSGESTWPCFYRPGKRLEYDVEFGLLYNWKAVMHDYSGSESNPSGVQGICPNGWHVPSKVEFEELKKYCEKHYVVGGNTENIGKSLAASEVWDVSTHKNTIGNNLRGNNTSGFSALPAGCFFSQLLGYQNVGHSAGFWSATPNGSDRAYSIYLLSSAKDVTFYDENLSCALSIRCVSNRPIGSGVNPKDPIPVTHPTVTTNAVSNITATSASCGGNVTSDGGATVTARGVCWSTSGNPTISNSHTVDGSGIGNFTSTLTELTPNTTYYVRAYATNSNGTAYGSEELLITEAGLPCQGVEIITDRDGNKYNTVQIGSQCWMRENLRTTRYADGTYISQGRSCSFSTPYWYYPHLSSGNKTTFGLLYNRSAIMRQASSSNRIPSGVQGICPNGWHIPSKAEFENLISHIGNSAKALASKSGWQSSTSGYTVGNNPSANNTSGFSALPAGYFAGTSCYFGQGAYFWSSTHRGNSNSDYSYCLHLTYNSDIIDFDESSDNGCSVRCIKD